MAAVKSTLKSAIFKRANELINEGYDRKQAFAIVYSELRTSVGRGLKTPKVKKNPAPKRKNAARTQKAAESYVRRPSQITKKAPSKRLKKRRTINLQTPRGVFPNPSTRLGDFYKNYRAFSAAARLRKQDPAALIASGAYVREDDGHILAKAVMPVKKNTVRKSPEPKTKKYFISTEHKEGRLYFDGIGFSKLKSSAVDFRNKENATKRGVALADFFNKPMGIIIE